MLLITDLEAVEEKEELLVDSRHASVSRDTRSDIH